MSKFRKMFTPVQEYKILHFYWTSIKSIFLRTWLYLIKHLFEYVKFKNQYVDIWSRRATKHAFSIEMIKINVVNDKFT